MSAPLLHLTTGGEEEEEEDVLNIRYYYMHPRNLIPTPQQFYIANNKYPIN